MMQPERRFVVYGGTEALPLDGETTAISLTDLCAELGGHLRSGRTVCLSTQT